MTIESPCVQVCLIDPISRLCRGCGRTLTEISAWTRLAPSERAAITARLRARMGAAGLTPSSDRPAPG
jgi:predicted Fe-S protein YdhL (DUF1289 family)